MIPEVARRHYLEAMGITAWASRYQLPNALATEACEWEDAPVAEPPRERLHALLDDAPAPRPRSAALGVKHAPEVAAVPASPSAVRALLGQEPSAVASEPAEAPTASATNKAPVATPPLQFSLSCLCIDGRWLSLHAGQISPLEQQLLTHVLQAAGLVNGSMPAITVFKWPPMANTFASEDPLEEAREGVGAFIAGAAGRQGWQLERVLWWGALEEDADHLSLNQVMAVAQGRSETLSLPVWQGPSLSLLAQSADAKRKLWPELVALGQQWKTAS